MLALVEDVYVSHALTKSSVEPRIAFICDSANGEAALLEDKIARLKELLAKREEIDAELALLLGMEPRKPRRPRKPRGPNKQRGRPRINAKEKGPAETEAKSSN